MFKQALSSLLCVFLLVTLCLGTASSSQPVAIFWRSNGTSFRRLVIDFADGSSQNIRLVINQNHVVRSLDPATVKRVSLFSRGETKIFKIEPTSFVKGRTYGNMASTQLYLNTTAKLVDQRRKAIASYH